MNDRPWHLRSASPGAPQQRPDRIVRSWRLDPATYSRPPVLSPIPALPAARDLVFVLALLVGLGTLAVMAHCELVALRGRPKPPPAAFNRA